MAKYIDADLLRKEIEFAKSVYDNPQRVVVGVADAFRQDGRAAMCDDILKKIASLQQEEPVPNDLVEAAEEYEKKHTYQRYDGGGLTPEYDATLAEAFIAGYKLHEVNTPLPEDTVIWNDGFKTGREVGKRDMKDQMMEEAVEGIVTECYGYEKNEDGEWGQVVHPIIRINVEKYSLGDKVRVIIIKEDEQC